jgi:hemoglobin-like flavoprotein
MFAEHSEPLEGIFNRGNQDRGGQQQALAGSVAAFASCPGLRQSRDELQFTRRHGMRGYQDGRGPA